MGKRQQIEHNTEKRKGAEFLKTVNVISISGGKDSTALWLKAIEEKTENMKVVFCDVGHEHSETYKYIKYLEEKLGPIQIVKPDFSMQVKRRWEYVNTKWREEGVDEQIIENALSVLHPTGNPFLDLCLWKTRFPSSKARFCTQELKIIPMLEQVYHPILDAGDKIVSWQGIRADESFARRNLPEREETPEGFEIYRPLMKWKVEDVFAMHDKYGIEPNPLYKLGMGRVGCMPCINARKGEIFEIARRFPEEIERVREWERIVGLSSKRGSATFFTSDERGHGIDEIVEWSKTSRGGSNYDLVKLIDFDDVPQCSSQYGLCE